MANKEKADFIKRATDWLMPKNDPELAEQAQESYYINGIYTGKSMRIHRMIRLAWARGVRKGASAVWDGQQPVTLRGSGVKSVDFSEMKQGLAEQPYDALYAHHESEGKP